MARRGRRLTIGGSGTEDDTVGGAPRGEVKSYLPPSEADQATQAAAIAAAATPSPDAAPIIVMPPVDVPVSGGDSPGAPGGEGPGGSPGGPSGSAPGDDAGVEAKGGLLHGSSSEHPITAQAGEFVMQRSAVQKYGAAFMKHINEGTAQVMSPADAQQHFAKGGMVLGQGGRFKKLEGQLADKGAKDPAALAAYIGRKKYGGARFARLAHGGH